MAKPFSADCLSVGGLTGSIAGKYFVDRWDGICRIRSIDWDSAVFCAADDSTGATVSLTQTERLQIESEIVRLLIKVPDGHLIDRVTLRNNYGNQQSLFDCIAIT